MQTSTLAQLKKELQSLPPDRLVELCSRLARYKKENKELLHYLLFEEHDKQQYMMQVKQEADELFENMNDSNVYYAKKSIRKILRMLNRHIKYAADPQICIELLIYFLMKLKKNPRLLKNSTQLSNLYDAQVKKINTELKKLHEDLQYDYRKDLDML